MLSSLLLAAVPLGDFEVPAGFSVERAAAASHSYLALAVDPAGRVVLATERAGLLLAEDSDGDGFFESSTSLSTELVGAQGLCFSGSDLFVVGRRILDGEPTSGLWRLTLSEDGTAVTDPRLVIAIDDDDEHGAHGVIPGPDGTLLVVVGDRARFRTPAQNAADWSAPAAGYALAPLSDPGGFDAGRAWPFGFVARVDPGRGTWEVHSAGYRNPYDLARDAAGELLTVESDMEWDTGLPWYRPVRVLVCEEGSDQGGRNGSEAWREHWGQSPPALLELGRASPTGVVVYDASAFPERYRGALLFGDWTNARIVAVHRDGGSAGAETLVQSTGALNVTDLAIAPDGSLLFVTGGRGTAGRLLRLAWDPDAPAPPAFEVEPRPAPSADSVRAIGEVRALQRAARARSLPAQAAAAALQRFPSGERALDEELAVLLALAAPPGAIDALLAELEGDGEHDWRIHVADCLRSVETSWTVATRGRLLAFFEESASWTGGGNLQGYLQLMLEEVIADLSLGDVRALDAAGVLGPRGIATSLARLGPEDAGFLLPDLREAFAGFDDDEDLARAQDRKRALLRSLAGAASPELATWLRSVYAREPRLRDDVTLLLTQEPDRDDFERFVSGLVGARPDVRNACVSALLRLGKRPTDAGTYRRVLDGARKAGPRAGRKLLRVLSHWGGHPLGPADPQAWPGELAGWESWFARLFPDYERPDSGPYEGPAWDLEATLGFLERTARRPGSAARGALVFTKTSCHTCHTLGAIGTGWAPDMTGVTRRFSPRELLEAIIDPSRVIAERYATTEVTTRGGGVVEGRLVRESEESIVLLHANGTRSTIARGDVSRMAPSQVSAMPEGLLDALTLEEVKDLVAYLDADGALDPAATLEPTWVDILANTQRKNWTGSFDGWTQEGGVLLGRAANQKRNSYMVYDVAHADFELELDVLTDGNTGVQYRSTIVEGEMDPVGYQLDIGKRFWGSIYATDGRGKIAGPGGEQIDEAVRADGWNHVWMRVTGDRHVVEINGYPLADARDAVFSEGVFALQLHRKMDMRVALTNLRIRRIASR